MGDSTETKKLKLQHKLATKELVRRVQLVNYYAGFVFLHFFFARFFFFGHTPLHGSLLFSPHPLSTHHFSNSVSNNIKKLMLNLCSYILWFYLRTKLFVLFSNAGLAAKLRKNAWKSCSYCAISPFILHPTNNNGRERD